MLDLNTAEEQRPSSDLIPDGTFCKVISKIQPGGVHGMNERDAGVLTAAKKTDTILLSLEFVVMSGPFAKRKLWEMWPVSGNGWPMTMRKTRAAVESKHNILPKDSSEAANSKRVLDAWIDLDGSEFAIKIGIKKGGPDGNGGFYQDKNIIARIVVPGEPEYAPLMAGQQVEAKPVRSRAVAAGSGASGGWSANLTPATPAAPPPPQQWGNPQPPSPPASSQQWNGVQTAAPQQQSVGSAPLGPKWLDS